MKINTASSGIKNRIGKKMIYIYQNSSQKDQDNPASVILKKKESDGDGNKKMYPVMKKKSKHIGISGLDFANRTVPLSLH